MEEKENKYGYLNHLSTTYLEGILRADIESSEDGDIDMILYITEVIERREKEHPTGCLCDVGEAWKEFQEHYMDLEGPLYPMSDPDNAQEQENSDMIVVPSKAPSKAKPTGKPSHGVYRTFLRWVLPIAASVALLLAGMITAQAAGIDVFGALAKWTDDTFRFISPQSKNMAQVTGEEEINSNSQELHDAFQAALDECGITAALAPTWFPDGCVMSKEPKITSTEFTNQVACEYEISDCQSFIIFIQHYISAIAPESVSIEKDFQSVEQYLSNGKLFFIMSNNESINAAWSDGQTLVVTVTGNLATENLKKFLDSMGV